MMHEKHKIRARNKGSKRFRSIIYEGYTFQIQVSFSDHLPELENIQLIIKPQVIT